MANYRTSWLSDSASSRVLALSNKPGTSQLCELTMMAVDDPVQSSQQIPGYETHEWQLARYARLPTEAPSTVATDERSRSNQDDGNAWEEWTSSTHDPKLLTRLAGFGHLCILYGSEVLESYFLILAKKWMRIVLVDDEVMVLAKRLNKTCRLRLTFQSKSEAEDFYTALSQFASSKEQPHEDSVGEELSKVLASSAAGLPPTSWTTEWPTASLEGLVRLCLQDPNFPGFVRQVDAAMKSLTNSRLPFFGPC